MLICLLTNSTAYAKKERLKQPKGIIIHSTGKNDPYLKNYFQPTSTDRDIAWISDELGKSNSITDYNHSSRTHNFHFWIGKNSHDKVITAKTIPVYYKVWNDDYIHICVCEDSKSDIEYARACYKECEKLCRSLLRQYPEIKVLDHSEISKMPDINYWFEKFDFSIADLREELKKQKFDF